MVMAATNAVGEKSAYGMHRIKTYLWSTTCLSQVRSNNLLALHLKKVRTDELHLKTCLNEFVCGSDHRTGMFGKFNFAYFPSFVYVCSNFVQHLCLI